MSYPGFCAKYGEPKMFLAALAAPPALNTAWQVAQSGSMEDIVLTNMLAFSAGMSGFFGAAAAHNVTDSVLRYKEVGLTRGANIVRKVQAATYAATVSCMLAFNGLVSSDQMENEEELPAVDGTPPVVDEVNDNNFADGPDIERCKNAQGENELIIEIPAEHIQAGEQETVVLSCEV